MNDSPTSFGRYRLIKRLAVGGMAELYQAVLPGPSGFSKTVAIKKILPQLNRHSRFRKMFLHEGRIMAALNHRNIVQVFELGEENKELYLCLELVEGCDLARVLKWQKQDIRFLDPPLAAWIARELCRGLAYMHNITDEEGQELQVVHRDVNPHNILLSNQGDVKLGDFGISKSLVREVLTQQGQVRGKVEYLSPEQAGGDSVGPASDIYSVGLILFEMLAGERYLQGERQLDIIRRATKPIWRPILPTNPAIAHNLQSIVQRALRAEPEQRFASADALADTLTSYLDTLTHKPGAKELARLVAQAQQGPDFTPTPPNQAPLAEPAQANTGVTTSQVKPAPPEGESHHTLSLMDARAGSPPAKQRSKSRLGWWLGLVAILAAAVGWLWMTPKMPSLAKPQPTHSLATKPGPEPKPTQQETLIAQPITPPKKNLRKRWKKTRRQNGNKKTRTQASKTPLPTAVDQTPTTTPGPTRSNLETRLRRLRQKTIKLGIRKGDLPQLDVSFKSIRQSIAAKKNIRADQKLAELDARLGQVNIGRAFVETKIKRLQKALSRAGLETQYSDQNRKILSHAINNRFAEANRVINSVFDQIRKKKT